jgi:voltage-gated potassium channel
MNKLFRSNITSALLLLLLVFCSGAVGYRVFSGYSWIDAIYMTIITVTTVGFKEVHPLSPAEKIFTSILILSSIFIIGYAVKVISEYILSQNNIGNFKMKRVKKTIEKLNNHVIVCGYGRNGKQACEKLRDYKRDFVIVEMSEELIEHYADDDTLFIQGNAVDDQTLYEAGIERASTLICALPSDADNLFVVLSAKQINPNLRIISRASQDTSFQKLKLAGADNVILPDKIGGDHMANLVVTPDLVEFLDNLSVSGEADSINVEQIPFEKVCTDGRERTIMELDIRKQTGCSVIGYKGPDGNYIVNPSPKQLVERDSKLILIGRPNQIDDLKKLYGV